MINVRVLGGVYTSDKVYKMGQRWTSIRCSGGFIYTDTHGTHINLDRTFKSKFIVNENEKAPTIYDFFFLTDLAKDQLAHVQNWQNKMDPKGKLVNPTDRERKIVKGFKFSTLCHYQKHDKNVYTSILFLFGKKVNLTLRKSDNF